ncbi:MAG: hypothetical protein TREMPRED_002493 [Tremellales sp. Tagirdzhanova-0007]|nr:MAG: hypothetical protein TREMPRED_002493 [Tremellales sp. Tagirdzhanova-0007]
MHTRSELASSSKRSGGLFLATNTKKGKLNPKKRFGRAERSIWNSKDDWETLVADSALSTSSVSTRPPRPRGLHSLVKCASDAAARNFKRLWNDGVVMADGAVVYGAGKRWKIAWERIPEHLKAGLRDGIFKWWGSYVTPMMLQDIFFLPPSVYLPGDLLPYISTAQRIKPLIPNEGLVPPITTLVLTDAKAASDVVIASLIRDTLQVINLKGCTLVGTKTMDAIITRCTKLRIVNLKGTQVKERDLQLLLLALGGQLQRLKVDTLSIKSCEKTFSSEPFPKITHLCLPGDFINAPSDHGWLAVYPPRKVVSEGARINWPHLGSIFPALTHLYLPGLLMPPRTEMGIFPNRLVKLSLGPGGPQVPILNLVGVIGFNDASLRSIHLGHLFSDQHQIEGNFEYLGDMLKECMLVEDFRLECGPAGTRSAECHQAMAKYSDLVYTKGMRGPWRKSLKVCAGSLLIYLSNNPKLTRIQHLSLALPQAIEPSLFLPDDPAGIDELGHSPPPALEILDLPAATIKDSSAFARAVSGLTNLRSLNVSSTTVTGESESPAIRDRTSYEEVFVILDGCPALSRIDLTLCRGVKVQHRRHIFKAWEESRLNEP